MGYVAGRAAQDQGITLYRQGDINYMLNAEPGSHAAALRRRARPLRPGDGLARRRRASTPSKRAVALGAEPSTPATDKTLDVPAIVGIGGSLLYFVDTLRRRRARAYDAEFDWLGEARSRSPRASASTISTT